MGIDELMKGHAFAVCQVCDVKKELADLKEKYNILIAKHIDLKQAIVAYANAKKLLNSQDEFKKMVGLIGYKVVDCSGIATIKEE